MLPVLTKDCRAADVHPTGTPSSGKNVVCPALSALPSFRSRIPRGEALGSSRPGPSGRMRGLKGQDKIAQAEGSRRRPQAWGTHSLRSRPDGAGPPSDSPETHDQSQTYRSIVRHSMPLQERPEFVLKRRLRHDVSAGRCNPTT